MKENRSYIQLGDSIECSIRLSDTNWQISAQGQGKNRTEAFRNALKTLVYLTTVNTNDIVKNIRHK